MSSPMIPVLPGYSDLQLIANGSTALVFRATQARLNRMVAVKVLLIDDVMTTQATVDQELATTVALSSQPHIVSIIDTGNTADGNPYIVMEYCEGGSYAQILKQRGPLTVPEVLEVGMKIGEALHAAHQAGIVHRDVKPPNILRSQFGPALADFGIARAPDALAGTMTMGKLTPHHASPEAFMLGAQSGSSDLYSLASTMWNLLAGRPPFADPNASNDPMAFRDRVLNQPVPRVPRDDVPEWLHEELTRAMAKNPAERHTSAMAFAEALRRHSYGMNATTSAATNASSIAVANTAASTGFAPPASPFAPPQATGAVAPVTGQPGPPVQAGGHTEWPMWPAPGENTGGPPRKTWDPVPEWQQQNTTLAGSDVASPAVAPHNDAPETEGKKTSGPTGFTAAPLNAPVAPISSPPVSGPPGVFRAPSAPEAPAPRSPFAPQPPFAPAPSGSPSGFAPQPAAPTHQPSGYAEPAPFSPAPFSPAPVSGQPVSAQPYSPQPVSAPPGAYPPVPVSPMVYQQPTPPGSNRLIVGLSAAAIVLIVLIVGGIVALNSGGTTTDKSVPDATGTIGVTKQGAPTNVTLKDSPDGSSIVISWVDNSGGRAPTTITSHRVGDTAPALQPVVLEAGVATHEFKGGLNANYDYCFVVAAVYPGANIAPAGEVCTKRVLPSAGASKAPTKAPSATKSPSATRG
ncbi:protein kinase [Longispora sp. NPDC051575]|uniref:serine/threonine-protein kinase n=1 Tax=Longispora sp. NPDC051575 TaxID=3154943 RepID=UPI003427FA99